MSAVSNSTVRKALIAGGVMVAIAFALAVSTDIWLAKSDAFVAAERFMRASGELSELVGPIKEVSISSSGESSLNDYGNDGTAELSIDVTGARAKAIGQVHLVKKLRVWQVSRAEIRRLDDNRLISLLGSDR